MYVSIEEAKEYIESYYGSTDFLRIKWTALSDPDKLVCLNRAEQIIDGLPFTGCPVSADKAFPRTPFEDICMAQVRIATVELAVQSLDIQTATRYNLQKQGVRSFRIGDLSESFSGKNGGTGVNAQALSIVFPYLQKWLGGGYRICPTRLKR